MIVNGFCKDVFRAPATECAIDAPRDVADGVNALKGLERVATLATHCRRRLDHIVPDRVHVPSGGHIATSGGQGLALELESRGCEWVREAAGA